MWAKTREICQSHSDIQAIEGVKLPPPTKLSWGGITDTQASAVGADQKNLEVSVKSTASKLGAHLKFLKKITKDNITLNIVYWVPMQNRIFTQISTCANALPIEN